MGQERGLGCCSLGTKLLKVGTRSSGVGSHREVAVESHDVRTFPDAGGAEK